MRGDINNHFKDSEKQSEKPTKEQTKKTKIHLKRYRENRIPEVQIKLDDMLSQAYSEMRTTSKRKLIGNSYAQRKDVYYLDNQLLKDYIYFIYGQYNLQDPVTKKTVDFTTTYDEFSDKGNDTNVFESTPKRIGSFENNESKQSRKKTRSKTLEKLSKMKKDFQIQLGNNGDENPQKTRINRKSNFYTRVNTVSDFKEESEERRFPLNKTVKKIKIKITNQRNNQKANRSSHLFKQTNFHYCLMCEEPLEDNVITKHEKNCSQLKKFLNQKVLSKTQIVSILNLKIQKLEREIKREMKGLKGDSSRIQTKLNNILSRKNISPGNEIKIEDERQEIKQFLSEMTLIKCWEKIDKYEWFKLMRARAQSQRPTNLTML